VNLQQCYQIFGITQPTTVDELKAIYRRLARKLHPDANPDDRFAQDRFIALNEAYKILMAEGDRVAATPTEKKTPPPNKVAESTRTRVEKKSPPSPTSTPEEMELKWKAFYLLQERLQNRQFPQAAAAVERLSEHFPEDTDVRQWRGVIYCAWASALIDSRQNAKARLYLKKAIAVDPHNMQLWHDVEKQYRRLDMLM
jgi:tetratricopeptide (TPR) repeat protein